MAPDPQDVDSDEGTIEARLPGFRYGIVLLLLLATFIVEASAYDGAWYRVVTVALDGLTLVAAFLASIATSCGSRGWLRSWHSWRP
jgi:hypothetical protein